MADQMQEVENVRPLTKRSERTTRTQCHPATYYLINGQGMAKVLEVRNKWEIDQVNLALFFSKTNKDCCPWSEYSSSYTAARCHRMNGVLSNFVWEIYERSNSREELCVFVQIRQSTGQTCEEATRLTSREERDQ